MRDYLGFSKDFFEQAVTDLKKGNVDGALENLKQLNHQAKRTLSFPVGGDKTFEWIITLTQLLILSDVLLASSLPSEKGTVIIPASRLSSKQRQTISAHVQEYCDKALEDLEKKPGNFFRYLRIITNFHSNARFLYREQGAEKNALI